MDEYRIVSILDDDFHMKDTDQAEEWMKDIFAKPVFQHGRAFANHLVDGTPTNMDLVTSIVLDVVCDTDEIIQFKTINSFYTFIRVDNLL